MIKQRQQLLQHHARTIQSRATSMTAIFMTVFLLCIEHVRAFANQYHLSAHDTMVLASAASSLTRKLGSGRTFSKLQQQRSNGVKSTTTRLNAWSVPAISLDMPAMPTTKDIPLHALGSWYSEVDPTTKPPVYDDDYENSYSFNSPTDDWPSMSATDTTLDAASAAAVKSHMRKGPLRSIKRAAGRFKGILAQ
eukprot:CAMPEP_0201739484 /NCGR_PEP_ID=MMETSP0593-20130828/45806_1 /ASSEMBLY_ACC=CAM_ASM_000672 /TAXON_ID=267983 /ORGANISM="Skeletonema japonicum, Strain CCMP2506" /LENGTH=192 /DNA_ID=CAMNT_0048233755 /DNA_START=129 /DNA_END=707 /DNA_ORIENTATION=-